ncbi:MULTISPECIES: hypothetical protein [Marinomonas]|uniref:Uncharacterized protein n=2 Tax=Marinomonas TaxID=28253 RepID=A0A7H1J838_9GAMM|nr:MULTISPECIES: hypothetical protein [Marinomonas]MCS7486696.1 hypothetical protein [Marinomonas sp. BSi20414]MCW4628664.1 hypothetical protein [Marinomonas sp. KJ51-3]QNT06654.1 hypothetical protein IBG28_03065 [Marinomonas arctica]GGN22532.1 hypothetical protein GCM10011350_10300 [Marinomonas arctica]
MLESPKVMSLVDSLVRIILTIVYFYTFKHFFVIENDLLLAFVSVLCAFITFKGGIFLFHKFIANKQ